MPLRRVLPLLHVLLLAFAAPALLRAQPAPSAPRNILVLGDSLTAGYGLPDPATQAYPALLQQKIDALAATSASNTPSPSSAPLAKTTSQSLPDNTSASASAPASGSASAPPTQPPAPWRVLNAGISGDTTSGGLRRIDWVSRQPVAILVLALGSNDGLRGLDPALVSQNLSAIVARIRAKNPSARILLLGQRMPANMGDYAARFDAVFPALAAEHGWAFAPFLLDGVGGVPEFNQADAIHPNEAGHARMAQTVWTALAPLLADK